MRSETVLPRAAMVNGMVRPRGKSSCTLAKPKLDVRWHLSSRRVISVVCAIGLFFVSSTGTTAQAAAASVEAPDEVCAGEQFEVDWSGPNASGDRITIADSAAAPGVSHDRAQTTAGNPSELTAPLVPGVYDVRYVANQPLAVSAKTPITVQDCLSSATSGTCPPANYPVEDYALVVNGVQSDSGSQFSSQSGFTLDQLCSASGSLEGMLSGLVNRVQVPLGVPADQITSQVANQLRAARDEICGEKDLKGTNNWFTITYAYCRMAMDTVPYSMDIHLPPGSSEGTMSIAEHERHEIMRMSLKRNVDAASEYTGKGWAGGINMTPTSQSGSHVGYNTREYRFDYTAGLGVAGGPTSGADSASMGSPAALGNMVSVKNEGTVWMANCVPGVDIMRAFYTKLSSEVQPDQASASFLSGIINSLVGMLENGMPLEIQQTSSAKVAGMNMGGGSSHAIVSDFEMIPLPPQWCSQSLMPANYKVNDMDAQLAKMRGGSSASASRSNSAPAAADSAGLGSMLNSMISGMQQAAGGQQSAGGQSSAAASRSSSPSSANLDTGNLVQTTQKYLQVLGYDPGPADGKAGTQTMIAISQFQAEKGMKVTGEVTPQLVGILAAEVDAQR